MKKEICSVCSSKMTVIYDGQIRLGKPGTLTKECHQIISCEGCEIAFSTAKNVNYETDEYRKLVNNSASEKDYYAQHDSQQLEKIQLLETLDPRGKVVADIGTGAGSFLDYISGFVKETVAIEPTQAYHKALKAKGHKIYPYTKDALTQNNFKVDIATSFAVIEHVDNPITFLKEINELIAPGGYLILSTPNHNDWLINFLGTPYKEFYYRLVHKWYFNEKSLKALGEKCGFKEFSFIYKQQYDISNFLHWLKDHKPTGLRKTNDLCDLDHSFKRILEKNKTSNYLYVILKK